MSGRPMALKVLPALPTTSARVGEWPASQHARLSLLGLFGLVLPLLGGCASAPSPPSKPLDACAIFNERPSWYKATKKAERKWGTPVAVQLAIIQAESSFRHDARPPGRVSSAYGYSQAIDGTWDWYREQTGNRRAARTNFDHAVDFVGWYTDVTHRTLGISKGDGYRQYLAYHEGHRGFQRGTYRKKDWLVRVARRVDQQAKTYGAQLRACRR
ncbi:MAG: transglycosylase SLT domain-containing protein [Thiocapsa sp. C3-sup]